MTDGRLGRCGRGSKERPVVTRPAMVVASVVTALGLAACSPDPVPAAPVPAASPASASPSITPAPAPHPSNSTRAAPAAPGLEFPGHLPGARVRSTYTRHRSASVVWPVHAGTASWVLRVACTSSRGGAKLRYQVSEARRGAVDDEEQLAIADGTVRCDGRVEVAELGRLKRGRVGVDLYVDHHTLRAYGIVVPRRG